MTRLADKHMASSTWYGDLPADGAPSWLDGLRRCGIERFDAVGFPSHDSEEWRFTQLAPITRTKFRPARRDARGRAVAQAVDAQTFGSEADCELVLVNGFHEPEFSTGNARLPRGVTIGRLAAPGSDSEIARQHLGRLARVEANPFVALNTGSLQDGVIVHVARGVRLERPIHVLFLSVPGEEPAVAHPRLLIVLEPGAQASLVESYCAAGDGVYFTNAVTEIVVGPDATIDHCKLQEESVSAYHVATMQVELARNAEFVSHSASLGSRITRNDLNVTMAADHARATLNGLVLIEGEQHVDNHTNLDHAAPDCSSHELYKHVLDDRATGVFKGRILVRHGAQKTDSKQTGKTLLLSDDAVMNSQPALEIYADDVKCTHGSTTGPVDDEQVFYLRSRGIGLDAARHLLTYAFAADITRRIKVDPVRRRLEGLMAARHGLPRDLRITDLGAHDEAARNL